MTVEFFSAMDKVDGPAGRGQIASSMPAWYFSKNIEDLEQDIAQTKRRLESGRIPHKMEGQTRAQLARMEKKLSELKDSKPNMGEGANVVGKMYKDLGKIIGERLPTRTENMRGTTDPAKLADLMSKPVIQVPDYIAQIAEKNGLRVSKDCKMSLTDASILWKMGGRLCDGETNVEVLRRDK
jgi:hypothetical protein